MIMIPLTYLIAFAALVFAAREWFTFEPGERNVSFVILLLALAFQVTLVGTRFGYGLEWLVRVQPITASLLPPLAYLAFREHDMRVRLAVIGVPLLLAFTCMLMQLTALDVFLALNNLVFAVLLARIGLGGAAAMAWAGLNRLRTWAVLLWFICAQLVYSGVADGLIAFDFLLNRGANTGTIVAYASLIGLLSVLAGGAVVLWYLRRKPMPSSSLNTELDAENFNRIDDYLTREKLYLDADLNLNRIARRLSLPVRDVSRAINALSGTNVSQYINRLRVLEACRLIGDEDASVTSAIYASGFNTKSNFNREFLRVTGYTPSAWRTQQRTEATD